MTSYPLCLHHELALLALDDSRGTFAGTMYQYGFAGAILSELLLQGLITASDDKQKSVNVVGDQSTGDPILDEVKSMIHVANKPQGLQYWVSKVAGIRDLHHRVAGQLSELGIVSKVEGKVLWIFTRRLWPELDGTYEDAIRKRMAEVMFDSKRLPDERTAVLIAIAVATDVLKANFPPVELRQHQARVKEISEGKRLAAGATKQAIEAAQAAIMAATIAATTATTVITAGS